MKTNSIRCTLKSTNVNGWPCVRIKNNSTEFQTVVITGEVTEFDLDIAACSDSETLIIERYGKTVNNQQNNADQIVEIVDLTVDGISIPDFILNKFSIFEFNDQTHVGSRYFSPNGIWKFEFQTPIITWILDQKILHESQYGQDYIYPWSYKFGPESVTKLDAQLISVYNKVQQIL